MFGVSTMQIMVLVSTLECKRKKQVSGTLPVVSTEHITSLILMYRLIQAQCSEILFANTVYKWLLWEIISRSCFLCCGFLCSDRLLVRWRSPSCIVTFAFWATLVNKLDKRVSDCWPSVITKIQLQRHSAKVRIQETFVVTVSKFDIFNKQNNAMSIKSCLMSKQASICFVGYVWRRNSPAGEGQGTGFISRQQTAFMWAF